MSGTYHLFGDVTFLIFSGSKVATAINGATLVLSVPDRYRWLYTYIHVYTYGHYYSVFPVYTSSYVIVIDWLTRDYGR